MWCMSDFKGYQSEFAFSTLYVERINKLDLEAKWVDIHPYVRFKTLHWSIILEAKTMARV